MRYRRDERARPLLAALLLVALAAGAGASLDGGVASAGSTAAVSVPLAPTALAGLPGFEAGAGEAQEPVSTPAASGLGIRVRSSSIRPIAGDIRSSRQRTPGLVSAARAPPPVLS